MLHSSPNTPLEEPHACMWVDAFFSCAASPRAYLHDFLLRSLKKIVGSCTHSQPEGIGGGSALPISILRHVAVFLAYTRPRCNMSSPFTQTVAQVS